jgi:hypothetical protein
VARRVLEIVAYLFEPFGLRSSAMSTYMDSDAIFEERLRKCGVAASHIASFVQAGINNLAKLAFCCSYTPSMPDENPLVSFFTKTLVREGDDTLDAGTLSGLRRAFFEAHTFMLAELRQKVEKKPDDAPKSMPQPERTARLLSQRTRLSGVPIQGPSEPSNSLIDLVAQQKEDETIRYIDLTLCVSRESEVRCAKDSKSNKADVSSSLAVRQCFQRRNLAYDQLDIATYDFLEGWTNYLFSLVQREPVTVAGITLPRVQLQQIIEADKQVFVLASDLCRSGLSKTATGSYPLEEAINEVRHDPLISSMLQPIIATGKRRQSGDGNVDDKDAGQKGGNSKSKGKGKGKKQRVGSSQSGPRVPKEFIGLNTKAADGTPLCYAFSLSGCKNAAVGKKCNRGLHCCPRCLGSHCLKDCPQQVE